jgi:polysaccharide pyruvyl transferase WcaK-like protein
LGDLLHALSALGPQPIVIVKQPPYDNFLIDLAGSANAPVFGREHTYLQLMALQSKAIFQVTSRYHDFILGSIVGCPTIALASGSHKVHGACELMEGAVGMPYDGTDLRSCTPEIVARTRGYVAGPETLRAQLASRAEQLSADALAVGKMVSDVLASSQLSASG